MIWSQWEKPPLYDICTWLAEEKTHNYSVLRCGVSSKLSFVFVWHVHDLGSFLNLVWEGGLGFYVSLCLERIAFLAFLDVFLEGESLL